MEILAHAGGKEPIAILDVFELSQTRHDVYDMPKLYRPHSVQRLFVLSVKVRSLDPVHFRTELTYGASRLLNSTSMCSMIVAKRAAKRRANGSFNKNA